MQAAKALKILTDRFKFPEFSHQVTGTWLKILVMLKYKNMTENHQIKQIYILQFLIWNTHGMASTTV